MIYFTSITHLWSIKCALHMGAHRADISFDWMMMFIYLHFGHGESASSINTR